MATSKYSKYYVYIKPVIGNQYVKSTAPYIFSILAIIIFVIFAIRPTILTIISLQKNIKDNQQVLAVLDQKSQDLTDGKRNLDNLDPNIKTLINTRLPDTVEVTTLINDLQTAALKTASISALQVQPITIYSNTSSNPSKKNIGEVLFSLNIQGSYPQLLQALDNIAKTPRLLNITSAIFSKSAGGEIGLSVSGKAYYLKE